MMYKCLDCGCLFEQPSTYTEDCTPGGAFEGGSFIQKYYGCPICEGAFGSAEECSICGEWEIVSYGNFDDDAFVCEECSKRMEETR